MIDVIRKILNEKYVVMEDASKIVIYSAKMSYPEESIVIEEKSELYSISQVSRSNCIEVMNTINYDEAMLGACILTDRFFEPLKRDLKVNTIKELVVNGKIDKAVKCINMEFTKDIFEIGIVDEKKVSLLINEDKADVLFMSEYLAQDASLPRAFAVLFNYCKKMKYIREWYKEIQDKYSIPLELCEKLYLLGKA